MSTIIKSFSELGEIMATDMSIIPPKMKHTENTEQLHEIVSRIAYLVGVPESNFCNDKLFDPYIYHELETNKSARIVRNLCILRTSLALHISYIHAQLTSEGRSLLNVDESVPQETVNALMKDGIKLIQRATCRPLEFIVNLNQQISDRINNCKSFIPEWLNWNYVRNLFIIQGGFSEESLKQTISDYRSNLSAYPYAVFINWDPNGSDGNILYNDQKFAELLYRRNGDEFKYMNKVIDASAHVKGNIYEFIEHSSRVVMIVDCENSDVYNIISMLNGLNVNILQKVRKIILINDEHTNAGWGELENCTEIPIEHIMTNRVMENKSLVDGTLIGKVFTERYEEEIDSFVLLSSDSDFWTLISSLKEKARFIVMVEHLKCSRSYKSLLANAGIYYCYLDDFNSGAASEQMKTDILLKTIRAGLQKKSFNISECFETALTSLRINMDEAHKKQFFQKYCRNMTIKIETDGKVVFELNGK